MKKQKSRQIRGVLPENNTTEKKEDAFTEPGNGEVQDDIQNGSSKEFLTITTKNNNTFYLVIDRSSTSQNVYLLSQVDENDLKEFVDQEKEPATVTPTPQVVIDENKTEETDKKEEIAKPEKEEDATSEYGSNGSDPYSCVRWSCSLLLLQDL